MRIDSQTLITSNETEGVGGPAPEEWGGCRGSLVTALVGLAVHDQISNRVKGPTVTAVTDIEGAATPVQYPHTPSFIPKASDLPSFQFHHTDRPSNLSLAWEWTVERWSGVWRICETFGSGQGF